MPVVYTDGAFEWDDVAAIGVYSEDLDIMVSEKLTVPGVTSNVAESEALLRGLHIVDEKKAHNAVFRVDSKVLTGWLNDGWQTKSKTGQKYVPLLRDLLDKTDSKVEWVPGSENLADGLSRKVLPVNLARLKSGHDEYSEMDLGDLLGLVSADELSTIDQKLPRANDKDLASALRWVLRGLSPQDATDKILLRREQAKKAKKEAIFRKYEMRFDDEHCGDQ
jgi:ribonuclease HI